MFLLDAKAERFAALSLAVLMAATRIHHFGAGTIAPDASTAVFFLTGLLLASPFWFVAFSVLAIGLDAIAIGIVGVTDACMSVGYWLLFAGYLALWYAGRLGRHVAKMDLGGAVRLAAFAVVGVMAFFVLSNLGYYFGGGFDESMGAAEYVRRVSRYFPAYFISTLVYAAAGVAVVIAADRLFAGDRLAAR
jgi:hypothetical protein